MYKVKNYGQVSEVDDENNHVHAVFTCAVDPEARLKRAQEWADEQNKKEGKG